MARSTPSYMTTLHADRLELFLDPIAVNVEVELAVRGVGADFDLLAGDVQDFARHGASISPNRADERRKVHENMIALKYLHDIGPGKKFRFPAEHHFLSVLLGIHYHFTVLATRLTSHAKNRLLRNCSKRLSALQP